VYYFVIVRLMRLLILFVFTVSFSMGIGQSYAQGIVTFGPRETRIDGSIPYTVIGKYKAQFRDFKGRIMLDERFQRIQSVYLEIDAGSIRSNCPWCDKIARSRRLLNIARYPKIIFESDQIIHTESGYKVKGVLEMHGIKKKMTFPFNVTIMTDQRTDQKLLDITGRWSINRKLFNIIWSRRLDHGGVLVGDYLTVDWGIRVHLKP